MSSVANLNQPPIRQPFQFEEIEKDAFQLEQEIYELKTRVSHFMPPHLFDQISTCQDDDDMSLREVRKKNNTHSIPALPPANVAFANQTLRASETITQISKPLGTDPSSPKSLEDVNQTPLKFLQNEETEAWLVKSVQECFQISRELIEGEGRINLQEMNLYIKRTRELVKEINKGFDEIEERNKKAGVLGWVHTSASIGLIGLGAAGFALALATGGISLLLTGLSAIATLCNTGVGVAGQGLRMKSTEQAGDVAVNQQLYNVEKDKQHAVSQNQHSCHQRDHQNVLANIEMVKNVLNINIFK